MRRRTALLLIPLLLLPGCVGLAKTNDPPADADLQQTATVDDDAPAPATPPTAAPSANNSRPANPSPAPAASANQTGTAAAAPEPAPAPRVDVLWWNGSTTSAGLGALEAQGNCCLVATAPDEGWTRFNVPEGAKGVVVELIWTDARVDLDLRVSAADYAPGDPQSGSLTTGHAWSAAGGAPGQPDGHATIVVTDAEALAASGEWGWQVFGKGAAPQAAFQIVSSVFLDEAPADDYQAAAE